MSSSGGSFFRFHAFDHEDDRQTNEADDAEVAEVIDVGVDGGLDVEAIRDSGELMKARHVGADVIKSRAVKRAEFVRGDASGCEIA